MKSLPYKQIRALYDEQTIIVYQAYSPSIAKPALQAGRFVPPWSNNRMTWIKPSFLWMMERSNWGQKSGQECILAVRISRSGWEQALSLGVLSHAEGHLYGDAQGWREQLETSPVRIQWDPERSLRGEKLNHRAIQVGLGRTICELYNREWIRELTDMTPTVRRIRSLREAGEIARARDLLPRESAYPVSPELRRILDMDTD